MGDLHGWLISRKCGVEREALIVAFRVELVRVRRRPPSPDASRRLNSTVVDHRRLTVPLVSTLAAGPEASGGNITYRMAHACAVSECRRL
jgi:hypothetical protein